MVEKHHLAGQVGCRLDDLAPMPGLHGQDQVVIEREFATELPRYMSVKINTMLGRNCGGRFIGAVPNQRADPC